MLSTMNGSVEHAADVGTIDRPTMHAESDEATRVLVHDHEHPVAPEHDGLASKEIHAPQAVSRVSDERQPRGPSSASCRYSSGKRQRLGALSKQGNPFLRFLWCEAAAHAVRRDPDLQRFYRRKVVQKGFGKARVAAARKLGIRLWIMLRDQSDYAEFCRRGLARQS
jgi:transposase